MRKGREGEALNSAPSQRTIAQQPPAPGAPAKN